MPEFNDTPALVFRHTSYLTNELVETVGVQANCTDLNCPTADVSVTGCTWLARITRSIHTLEELVHPLVTVLSPLFFVLMGAKVDPTALFKPATLGLAALLAVLGVAGKYVAGFGGGRGTRAAVIGWGMVPRGEVGLIFVAAGAQLHLNGVPLLSADVQAGIIGALLITTVLGPVGLGWVLQGRAKV